VQRFPCTPGVLGDAALRWDREQHGYVVLAGWVPDPNKDPAVLPTEPGKAYTIGDAPKPK
jgi:hypothetical protein